jgi:galactose mutarotase-like enzyme
MITLNNELLQVLIHPRGAELQVLRKKSNGINYMWRGDPAFWGKFSPVLFPIVGQLKADGYSYNGKAYALPRHGFARDKMFTVQQATETAAEFMLRDDADSLAVYPFPFQLKISYALTGAQLIVRYEVINTGKENLLFSLGAHPAFAVPLLIEGQPTSYEDYSLEFSDSESLTRWKLAGGLQSGEQATIPLVNRVLPLRHELFVEDAIVLKNLPDKTIRLTCSKHPYALQFSSKNFPYFGIWAAANAPFVCLEPWSGIADRADHHQALAQKEGIQTLKPAEAWTAHWQVQCF